MSGCVWGVLMAQQQHATPWTASAACFTMSEHTHTDMAAKTHCACCGVLCCVLLLLRHLPAQAQWVVAAREPSADDIAAAFRVFDEEHLGQAVHSMPQVWRGWL